MVWTNQVTADDGLPGVDAVKVKPLKRRCSSRAGLSRYYSSKSQSFSSLDLVQCTPFGTSALALAKRPSSFDLHRGSLNSAGARAAPSRLRTEESCMSMTNEEDEDDSGADRCPCNDTIFTDPSDAIISPMASPSASPLQIYHSCSLATSAETPRAIAAAAAAPAPFADPQVQHQQLLLTTEYLGQLSALLPFQHAFSDASTADRSTSTSSCCSSSSPHSGFTTTAPSSRLSFCDSASGTAAAASAAAAAASSWQEPDTPTAVYLGLHMCRAGAGDAGGVADESGPCCVARSWQYGSSAGAAMPSAFLGGDGPHAPYLDGPWGPLSVYGIKDRSRDAAAMGQMQLGGSARSRGCVSVGGCPLHGASGHFTPGLQHYHQFHQYQQSPSAASFPEAIRAAAGGCDALAVPGPGSSPACSACKSSMSAATAAAAAAAMAAVAAGAAGGASSAAHMRRLGLSARHRLRLSAAGRGSHQEGKPLWGSTEDLIASLSISDKQHPHAAARRGGAPARGIASVGVGRGSGTEGTSASSVAMQGQGVAPACPAQHQVQRQPQPQQQCPPHPLPQSQLGAELRCWGGAHPAAGAVGGAPSAMEAACEHGVGSIGRQWGGCKSVGLAPSQPSGWTYGSAPTPTLYGLLSGGF